MNISQKTWALVVVALLFLGGFLIFVGAPEDGADKTRDVSTDTATSTSLDDIASGTVDLFRDEMVSVATERLGQPIEGFTAFMFLDAFPGLEQKDFDGVKAFEGEYVYKNNKLEFRRTEEMPVTSAESTVASEGYRTLLQNVSNRLGIEVSTSSVNDLVQTLGEGFESEQKASEDQEDSGAESNKVLVDKIEESFSLARDWLVGAMEEKDIFKYEYDPIEGEYSNSNNMIRQLMASRTFAELAQDDPSLVPQHRKNLKFMLEYWYRETPDAESGTEDRPEGLGYIYYNNKAKLGASAMAIRAIVSSPLYEEHKEYAHKLAEGILYLQEENGSLKPWFIEPVYSYDRDYINAFYSGEAVLALVELYNKSGNKRYLDAVKEAEEYYLGHYITNGTDDYYYYPAYVPWHTMALNKLYKITGDKKYADAIFVLNDELLKIQDKSSNPLTRGRFYNPEYSEYGSPHASSDGVYLDGLAYAYEIAKMVGDEAHREKYIKAIELAVDNLAFNLQYKGDIQFENPERLRGSFRINANNMGIRVDTTQHVMDAYMKLMEVL